MNRRIYNLLILTIWITILCSCSLPTSATTIACPANKKLCGNKYCYDPTIQVCSKIGSVLTCISACGQQCFDSSIQICLNGTICPIGSDLCEVKYDINSGNIIEPPRMQCYNPWSNLCLNHTVCYEKDRVCSGQCIPYNSSYQNLICANDNITLCRVQNESIYYKPNQIQVCNGSCYDIGYPPIKHCVNGNVQCISSCSGACYNPSIHSCINGTKCSLNENVCQTYRGPQCYDPSTHICINGTKCSLNENVCQTYMGLQCYDPVQYRCLKDTLCSMEYDLCSPERCYNPLYEKCLNGTVCSNDRVCDGQCISNYPQVCANDKRTLCNVTSYYSNYRPYQMHLCNGKCFDTTLQQCINGNVSCIDGICRDQCYNSAFHICINGTLCSVGLDLCEVKYDTYGGNIIEPPRLQCYNPWSQRCLNHTICHEKDRVCNGQCIPYNSSYQNLICANDNITLCRVQNESIYYKPNQIQVCNGSCYDIGYPPLKHCVNGNVQCISNCSGTCYNPSTHTCINDTKCSLNENVCQTYMGPRCYNPTQYRCSNDTLCPMASDRCSPGRCYNPLYEKCLNGTICSNNRVCGSQCINNSYQVCASDQKTVCNVPNYYSNYKSNQIKLCRGVCYDSLMQECPIELEISCIHDPDTQICVPQNISSPTTTTFSPSTINNISSLGWINSSDFSMDTSVVSSPTATSGVEKISTSMNSFMIDNTASSSVSSSFTSPSTILTASATRASPQETEITDTATFLATQASFTLILSSHSSSKDTDLSSTSYDTGSFSASVMAQTDPDNFILATETSADSSIYSTYVFSSTMESSLSITQLPTSTFAASSSVSSEIANIPPISSDTTTFSTFPAASSTMKITEVDPGGYSTSVETLLRTGSHSSDSFTSTTKPSSQATVSFTYIPSITSSALLKDTGAASMSSDLTTSSKFSNPSSVFNSRSSTVSTSKTSGTDSDASSDSIKTSSSSLSGSSDNMVLTTERPSQTTLTLTPELPLHSSCGATKVCANGTSCCSPHVEYRYYQHNRTRDYGQTCRTIVIGESNNDSFVIAIAFNDKKVIIININNFLVVLLSIIMTFSLLVLVPMAYVIITYRKELAVHFRVGYIFLKNHLTNSQRKQWETHPET